MFPDMMGKCSRCDIGKMAFEYVMTCSYCFTMSTLVWPIEEQVFGLPICCIENIHADISFLEMLIYPLDF